MARPRVELQTILETILGSRNVYFQPPETIKLKYPCVVYERVGGHTLHADNSKYRKLKRYNVTYMDEDPDSETPDVIEDLKYCELSNTFRNDNLNHWVFTIYF